MLSRLSPLTVYIYTPTDRRSARFRFGSRQRLISTDSDFSTHWEWLFACSALRRSIRFSLSEWPIRSTQCNTRALHTDNFPMQLHNFDFRHCLALHHVLHSMARCVQSAASRCVRARNAVTQCYASRVRKYGCAQLVRTVGSPGDCPPWIR